MQNRTAEIFQISDFFHYDECFKRYEATAQVEHARGFSTLIDELFKRIEFVFIVGNVDLVAVLTQDPNCVFDIVEEKELAREVTAPAARLFLHDEVANNTVRSRPSITKPFGTAAGRPPQTELRASRAIDLIKATP